MAVETCYFLQQRLGAAPLAQQRQSLREFHLVVEFGEANHISTAAAAIAEEKVFVWVYQEAWFVVLVQRAQPHPAASAERPRGLPIMRLQITHERNLLFQVVESLAIHGLLASIGRIRQSAMRSQAMMVGARKKRVPMTPAITQQQTLSSRRCAHRRKVDESGDSRWVFAVWRGLLHGSASGYPFAGLLPARHAEMSRRRQPVRQDGEGLPARPANPAPHPDAIVSVVVGLAEPPAVAGDRVVQA